MRKLTYIFLSILLTSGSCENDLSPNELAKLPAATQVGKNTFGCLVNGKAWVTRTSTDALASYQLGALLIDACIDETDREQCVGVNILSGVEINKVYDLSNDPTCGARFNWSLPTGICFYENEHTLNGHITITKLDQINYIVAGLFEFTTVVPGCDTIKVTDGRFDLNYAP